MTGMTMTTVAATESAAAAGAGAARVRAGLAPGDVVREWTGVSRSQVEVASRWLGDRPAVAATVMRVAAAHVDADDLTDVALLAGSRLAAVYPDAVDADMSGADDEALSCDEWRVIVAPHVRAAVGMVRVAARRRTTASSLYAAPVGAETVDPVVDGIDSADRPGLDPAARYLMGASDLIDALMAGTADDSDPMVAALGREVRRAYADAAAHDDRVAAARAACESRGDAAGTAAALASLAAGESPAQAEAARLAAVRAYVSKNWAAPTFRIARPALREAMAAVIRDAIAADPLIGADAYQCRVGHASRASVSVLPSAVAIAGPVRGPVHGVDGDAAHAALIADAQHLAVVEAGLRVRDDVQAERRRG